MKSLTPKNNRTILKTVALSKIFEGRGGTFSSRTKPVIAIDDINININKGATVGILGESGCGKTTLGRLLIALETPSRGDVFFEKENLQKLSPEKLRVKRRRMQMVFQDPLGSMNPRMRVGKAAVEPMIVHGLLPKGQSRQEEAVRLFSLVGLAPSLIQRLPHELSGGQRQRVCLARALSTNPALLIADEPVASLDISVQTQMIALFSELFNDEERTLVFISHDIRAVKALCQKVLVMYFGKIVEQGKTWEVMKNPAHPYTKVLINSICSLDPENRGLLKRDIPSADAQPKKGCLFKIRCERKMAICEDAVPKEKRIAPEHKVSCFSPIQ